MPLPSRSKSFLPSVSKPATNIGLAKAGSLAKSTLRSSLSGSSSFPKMGGSLSRATMEDIVHEMVEQVVDGSFDWEAFHRRLVLEDPDSDNSPRGVTLNLNMLKPGMTIGIRGPVHQGFHVVDRVQDGVITVKCQDGQMRSFPVSDLKNHEVVHPRAMV